MNKFKVGDWIRYINGKTKTTAQIVEVEMIKNFIGVSTGENVPIEDCEYWKPKPEDFVWDGYELVEVIDNLNSIKVCRQNSDNLEEVVLDEIEPFIGRLPTFIKNSNETDN